MAKYIKFYLSGKAYGLDIAPVQEILIADETPVYKIPNSPDFLAGMINLRGSLAPLVDLKIKLGMHMSRVTKSSRIVICKPGNGAVVGALVDELAELVSAEENQLEPNHAYLGEQSAIKGVLNGNTGRILIIDLGKALLETQ